MKRVLSLLALAGCAAPAPVTQPSPPPDETRIEAASEEWAGIARDAFKGRTLEEQERLAVSEKHYTLALGYYNRGDFDRAKVEAQKAVQAWHENLAARKLLAEILSLNGQAGAFTPAELDARICVLRVDQAQIEITKHVRDGERFANARMYGEALREFENAQFKILHLPYDVKAMNDLLPPVRERLLRCRRGLDQAAKAREDMARKAAESDAARR